MSGIAQRTPPAFGYREYEFWATASTADTELDGMEIADRSSGIGIYYPMFPGTIIGAAAMLGGQQNAGEITAKVQVNGVVTVLELVVPAVAFDPYSIIARGNIQFSAGDAINVVFDTSSDYDGPVHFGIAVGVVLELAGI